MAAAMIAVLTAKAKEVTGLDDLIHNDEHDKTEDEQEGDELGQHSASSIRMAASGEQEAIRCVVMVHRIRALRAESALGQRLSSPEFATMANLQQIAENRQTTWTEVWMIYIAFLAFDNDGSGALDEDEIPQAMAACDVQFGKSEFADKVETHTVTKWAIKFKDSGEMHRYTIDQIREKFGVEEVWPDMEVNHKKRGAATVLTKFDEKADKVEEYTLEEFIDLVSPRRRPWQKRRQKISALYHSQPVQLFIVRCTLRQTVQ